LVAGRGDDDLLDRALEVSLGFGGIGKMAGGFNDYLGAGRGPVELGRIALGVNLELFASTEMKSSPATMSLGKFPRDGVILEQMGQRSRAGQVIDGDKFNFRIAE